MGEVFADGALLSIDVPQGFSILTLDELQTLFGLPYDNLWGVRNESRRMRLCLLWKDSNAVLTKLVSEKSLAKRVENTFDTGLYFVYVFCLAVATMVSVRDLEFSRYLFILWYIAFAVFGSLALQLLFAKLLKLDGDLTLAASISLINSPPFVPMVAAVLKNNAVILPGIAIGLLGYAVGNYLGIGIFMLLTAL